MVRSAGKSKKFQECLKKPKTKQDEIVKKLIHNLCLHLFTINYTSQQKNLFLGGGSATQTSVAILKIVSASQVFEIHS